MQMIVGLILKIDIFYMYYSTQNVSAVSTILKERHHLAQATITRRLKTIKSWNNWIKEIENDFNLTINLGG